MSDLKNHEEDDEEEEEGDNFMLRALFGNLNNSGDLDLDDDYFDEGKEHLSALSVSCKDSLINIEKSDAPANFGKEREDYSRKADNAVDFEDEQEVVDVGPEAGAVSHDEQAIAQDEKFYARAALAGPLSRPEEEDYDEDDDYDKEEDTKEDNAGKEDFYEGQMGNPQQDALQGFKEKVIASNEAGVYDRDLSPEAPAYVRASVEHGSNFLELHREEFTALPLTKVIDAQRVSSKLELPVLYEEDGHAVLWFSELFGQHELPVLHRKDKKQQKSRIDLKDVQSQQQEEDDFSLLATGSARKGSWEEIQEVSADYVGREEDFSSKDLSSDDLLHGSDIIYNTQPNQGGWHPLIERIDVPSPTLQPIHQEDWEAAILWDDEFCTQVREDPVDCAHQWSGSIDEMDVDTREDDAVCIRMGDEPSRDNTEDMAFNREWHTCRPVSLECFNPKPRADCDTKHPQLLRLNTLPALREVDNAQKFSEKLERLNLQSSELMFGSWQEHIIWDRDNTLSRKPFSSNVILNLQDSNMMFEVIEGKSNNHLKAHAAAMILTPHMRNSNISDNKDALQIGLSSLARFNISNDKFYMNKKNPQQQKSSLKKRSVHGIKVLHSIPATKLQTMKPKLANKDLANFHRPKAIWYPHHNEVAAKEQGKLSVSGPMKVILKTMGGKGSKLNVDASESLESVKAKLLKKFRDLRTSERAKIFYCGKELEVSKSLAQQEVKPNSVLHLVRTKVHPWPKAQRLPGENKPTRPPGAFKKKSDLSVKDGHVFVAEYCEERPLLINNVGMGARLCTYYRKVSPTDSIAATLRTDKESSVGLVVPLEPVEESPFLGDIRPGETQGCLETNMFRAPAFHHRVPQTDFLLVRSAKGKVSLRRIDRSYVIGQQEPHMEVLTPSSKTVQNYLHNRLLTYMYRGFRSNGKPGSVTRLRADEVGLQFPFLSESFMRKHLRHCADLQRATGGELWWIMKHKFRIPSEEELRRMVTPENVCSYESMQAGLYHLKRMGVSKLTQPSGLSAAMNQLPDEALVLAAASHLERELQLTPWNLSCNFVAATMHGRGSLERLEITGAGDPSGRGLGFSYLRAAPKPPSATALVEKKAAAARGGGAVTGTDADLRRLSMDAAREVLLKFNVPESQIEKLTRWHRIALVRKLSSEQAASGVKLGASALNKFARGQRMSFLQVQQQTREKCQEIWDRQVQSLSAVLEENSESEGEANEDLDSFAGDLENLLEAEEGEADEVASTKAKKEGIRGPGARRRALEAQREEDIEDEEAEAAELRRMLMEDDEAEDGKKKKKTLATEKVLEESLQDQDKAAPEAKKSNIRKKKIIKRIIRTKKPDGTYTSKEILITDPKEVAQYLARKNAGENGILSKEKKVPFLSKKSKQTGFVREGQKLKKTMKGEGGRDGVQLVCGACKQVGHMRTNKKVCPMYAEEARASISKVESTEPIETPVRQGIKITLKSAGGTVQDKEQLSHPSGTSAPLKIPSLKIRLPIAGVVDVAAGSTSKVVESSALPIEDASTADAPKRLEDSSRIIKKIKVQKRPSGMRDHNEQMDARSNFNSGAIMQEEKLETAKTMFMRLPGAPTEGQASHQEEELPSAPLSEQDTLQKEMIEESRRRQEKKRLKEEKERRKAREKEEKRQRRIEEEAEKERLMIERQRDLEEQADAQRRMLEKRKEEEWQEFLRRERKKEEKRREEIRQQEYLRQQEQAAREFQLQEARELQLQAAREQQQQLARQLLERERMQARKEKMFIPSKRAPARDRRSTEYERGIGTKRRGIEMDDEDDAFESSQQPKRRKGGEVLLANILEGVVDQLRNARDISFLFLKPVTKKDAPDYLDIIRHPMDLSTIREKARKLTYKSRAHFRRDVFQIAENAHIYNDMRNPQIPPLADSLLSLCDRLLREKARDLAEAESTIEHIGEESSHTVSSRGTNRRTLRQY
ncbi:hypothetical protein GOP47_0030078 [Adiantum capillus-veneris]|nr:hypothetical protein GOP47_0030078 [Adiantum capillus-veneris]